MRLGIAPKLILALLGLTLVLLGVTLGLARWSFERGFLDYSIALEQERLTRIGERLVQGYARAGGHWRWLDDAGFRRLLADLAPGRPGFGFPPPPGAPARPPPPPLHPPLGPPTALYDAAGQRLAGVDLEALALREGETREPLRIPLTAQGRIIGELRSRIPPRRFNTPQATAFSRQQSLASLWIGLVALLVALLLSLLLARALLAPLRQVIAAVARLTEGDDPGPFTRKPADELGQLMHGIEQLARTLKANRTSRQRWLAAISHELRTPVTILHGEIELMKDGLRALDQAQLLSLDQEVNRLRHLIEDLYALSLADIGGLHYRFAPLDLHDALCIALDRVRTRATESGLRLRLESFSPVWIQADATRLDQLLGNLLDNALAYTDAPGEVRIGVTRDAREVTMRIDDTPPRPAAADLALLFEPLYRTAASHRRRRAGAGLGLAICRDIVTAHQGRIRACPSNLGGLCVEVTLPARSPP